MEMVEITRVLGFTMLLCIVSSQGAAECPEYCMDGGEPYSIGHRKQTYCADNYDSQSPAQYKVCTKSSDHEKCPYWKDPCGSHNSRSYSNSHYNPYDFNPCVYRRGYGNARHGGGNYHTGAGRGDYYDPCQDKHSNYGPPIDYNYGQDNYHHNYYPYNDYNRYPGYGDSYYDPYYGNSHYGYGSGYGLNSFTGAVDNFIGGFRNIFNGGGGLGNIFGGGGNGGYGNLFWLYLLARDDDDED